MQSVDAGLTIVGGGTGALGHAVVEHLVAEGRQVVVPVRGPDEPALPEGVTVISCDLSNSADVEDFGRRVMAMGPIAALVNCSGGFTMGPAAEASDAEILDQLELNLLGPWRLARLAARSMTGASRAGRIVTVVSRAAVDIAPGQSTYQVSKAAVARLTQVMALELRDSAITVNAVLPSVMDTPSNRVAMPTADHSRWVPVARVAGVIAWLLSPAAADVSGALVPVYGRG